jgi:hypothetical protein
MKECPMCGETMRLVTRERAQRLPGAPTARVKAAREWVCPECDYFEEAESDAG